MKDSVLAALKKAQQRKMGYVTIETLSGLIEGDTIPSSTTIRRRLATLEAQGLVKKLDKQGADYYALKENHG